FPTRRSSDLMQIFWPGSRPTVRSPASQNLATPAGLEPATCRLEGGCSIQLSYGAGIFGNSESQSASVRPGHDPIILEVVGVGKDLWRRRLRLFDAIGNPVARRVG